MSKWDSKNLVRELLYMVLYAVGTVVVCVLGSVHPIMFVCYQVTAGILLSGVAIKAFNQVRAPGVAACLALAIVIVFIVIQDVSVWHVAPLVVMALLAEAVRVVRGYDKVGDIVAAAIMTFSTFGFYGQIWFNRAFTYESAVAEMPAGYADALMAASPAWALPVAIVVGVCLSVLVSNMTIRLFKLEWK